MSRHLIRQTAADLGERVPPVRPSSLRWSAIVIAVVATAVGCIAADPNPIETPTAPAPSPSSSSPSPRSTESGEPREESSDGARVTVQESVVTAARDATGPTASYAVVVANPSTDIAVRTALDITLLDADGKPVTDQVVGRRTVRSAVNLVMPGDRQTITNLTYVERTVADIKVEVVDSVWFDGDDDRFIPVQATDVDIRQQDSDAEVSYRVDWPYQRDLGVVPTYAAFRDSEGNLIGGTSFNDAEPLRYTPGSNLGEIDVPAGAPDGWDSVEVHVDPFVQIPPR